MKPALALLLAFLSAVAPTAPAQTPPILPRAALFRAPDHASPLVSPDGSSLTWIAPTNGLPNLWVRYLATNDTRILSLDPRGSVRQPAWQPDSQAVLYLQEVDQAGTLHLMQAHVPSGIVRDLTPFTGIQARLVATSPRLSDEILVAMNLRHRRLFDVYRVDLRSGAVSPEAENTGDVTTWYAGDDLTPRLAQIVLPNGELALGTRPDARSVWRPLLRTDTEDTPAQVLGFGPGQSNVFVISSVRAPAPRLLSLDLTTGQAFALAQDARFEVTDALFQPKTHTFDGVQFTRARVQWQLANTNLLTDFEVLRRHRNGDLHVLSRDLADRTWTVGYGSADGPAYYCLYDRTARTVTPLFSDRPPLDAASLGTTRPISFSARDGRMIEGYLTLPPGSERRNLPGVLLVHGGPWSRVLWAFDPEVHWLANRGYAVLQVNFRGSSGYGRDHLDAGNKEWGGKILLDLLDARQWATDQGHLDPKRIAIMGTGFGGYATLATLARHPDAFTAGISLGGPPNLITMIQSVPTNALSIRSALQRRVGNPLSDSALLRDHSPATRAAAIKAPLLIAATGRDPQAPTEEMDAFVSAIRREGRAVDYLLFPEESVTLRNPINLLRFYAAAEAFLARHLGGRSEPPSKTEQFEPLKR